LSEREYGVLDEEVNDEDDVITYEVVRYENDGGTLWAVIQTPDGERHRVLVRDADGNYQW